MPETVPSKGRILWMDSVRGLAIMLMLLLHATMVPALYGGIAPAAWLVAVNDAVAPARMPVLMFLSGLLLHKSLQKPTRRFISGKLRALLWPYCVWAVIFLWAAGRINEVVTPWTWVQTIYLWYLSFILIYYLLMLALVKIPLWIPLTGALVAYTFFHVGERGFIQKFFFYWLFFQLGHLFTAYDWKRWLDGAPVRLAALMCLMGVLLAHNFRFSVPDGFPVLAAWWPLARAAAVVAVAIAWAPVLFRGGRTCVLASVGRNSLIFYVSHFPVMIGVSKLFAVLPELPSELVTLLCLAVALLVAQAFVALRERLPLAHAFFKAPAFPTGNRVESPV